MSSIRKRGNKYQVQVRTQGQKITKTFNKLSHARRFSVYYENKILLGNHLQTLNKNLSLRDLINKYLKEITPLKKGKDREQQRLNRLLREDLVNQKIYKLITKDFIEFKNRRIKDGNRTCRYDLALLHHIYNTAIKQWCYPITHNPLSNIQKPRCNPPRERRLNDNELKYILNHNFKNKSMNSIIKLAIETGMRKSEILSITNDDIKDNYILLSDTKNGNARKIPLTKKVKEIISKSKLPYSISCNAVRLNWSRMIKKTGILDLHFHDLRHEAISRFFEKGLSIPEVSLISGHKDVRQLMRYTHLDLIKLTEKLNKVPLLG
jgi:integrase